MISAYGTGMRIIKMSPIQAISNRENKVRNVLRFSLLGTIFGWKGTLAARNNQRQPKRFAVTVLSLTVSIMLVASFSLVLKAAVDYNSDPGEGVDKTDRKVLAQLAYTF